MANDTKSTTRTEHEIVITRTFNASRELVWRAWTEPEQIKKWWGPQHFTAPVAKVDLRVGGTYLYCMRDEEGKDYWSTGTYREITPMDRIVATDSFADEQGKIVPSSYYGLEGMPEEMLVTTEFSDDGAGTRVTLHHRGMPAGEIAEMATEGWNQQLDKLAALLAK